MEKTLNAKPKGAMHWSARALAEEVGGVSHVMVHRIWRSHRLQLHKDRPFKLSRDPEFGRVRDMVGLHMNPSDKAALTTMFISTEGVEGSN